MKDLITAESEDKVLVAEDCNPVILKAVQSAGLDDPLQKAPIKYAALVIDKDSSKKEAKQYVKMNEFFKKAAQFNGNTFAAKTFADATADLVKKTALKNASPDTLHEAVADKPDAQWTVADSVAVLKLEKRKGEASADQFAPLAQATMNMIALTPIVATLPMDAVSLASQGKSLKGADISVAPLVLDALTSIQTAGSQAQDTANRLTELGSALRDL